LLHRLNYRLWRRWEGSGGGGMEVLVMGDDVGNGGGSTFADLMPAIISRL
jgi:hypothetical protein